MIPHKQTILHDPANGKYGDCYRTALASIMDLPSPTDVPHFMDGEPPQEVLWPTVYAWLADRGLSLFFVAYDCHLDDMMNALKHTNPGMYCIVTGQSPRGTNHCVIALNGEVVHDPHPEGGGIVGPTSDGLYWVEVLVPSFMRLAYAPPKTGRGGVAVPKVPTYDEGFKRCWNKVGDALDSFVMLHQPIRDTVEEFRAGLQDVLNWHAAQYGFGPHACEPWLLETLDTGKKTYLSSYAGGNSEGGAWSELELRVVEPGKPDVFRKYREVKQEPLKLVQAEEADYFLVLNPVDNGVEFGYSAELGRSFGHQHIMDAQTCDGDPDRADSANSWVVRAVKLLEPFVVWKMAEAADLRGHEDNLGKPFDFPGIDPDKGRP